jgi:hypothetical protein
VAKMRGGVALTDADRWPWLDRLAAAAAASIGEGGFREGYSRVKAGTPRERERERSRLGAEAEGATRPSHGEIGAAASLVALLWQNALNVVGIRADRNVKGQESRPVRWFSSV